MSWSPDWTRVNGWIPRPGELCPHGDHGPADELVLRVGDHVDDGRELEQVEQVVRVTSPGLERRKQWGDTQQSRYKI